MFCPNCGKLNQLQNTSCYSCFCVFPKEIRRTNSNIVKHPQIPNYQKPSVSPTNVRKSFKLNRPSPLKPIDTKKILFKSNRPHLKKIRQQQPSTILSKELVVPTQKRNSLDKKNLSQQALKHSKTNNNTFSRKQSIKAQETSIPNKHIQAPQKNIGLISFLGSSLLDGVLALSFAVALFSLFATIETGLEKNFLNQLLTSILEKPIINILIIFTFIWSFSFAQSLISRIFSRCSFGSKIFNIQHIDSKTGKMIGLPHHILRALLNPLLSIFFGFGFFWALWLSSQHRYPVDALLGIKVQKRST